MVRLAARSVAGDCRESWRHEAKVMGFQIKTELRLVLHLKRDDVMSHLSKSRHGSRASADIEERV